MSPLVSIVINNYNHGRFVGEAIDSALGQAYHDVEVIVVDDGSTDNSRQVIESRGNKVWAIFKANGGQASAMNAGFAASKGDLILFLDSDDRLEANAIETVVHEWRDGVSRMIFPLELIDGRGERLGRAIGGARMPSLMHGPVDMGSPTSGNVFSRAALEKIMPIPEEDWRISADAYLNTASLFGEVRCLKQPLGCYRVHGANNSWCAEPLRLVRTRLDYDLRMYNVVFRLTGRKVGSLENWLGACPQHWVRRIKLLRENPQDYPWPDSLPKLTFRAVKATWRQPNRNFRRRLAYTVFAVGYAILPRKATQAMWSVEGRGRGRGLRRLLGT